MLFHKNILETIGDTPLVRLNKVISTSALVLAKIESFNPGNSTKDRMALKMIEDAEKKAYLRKVVQLLKLHQEIQVWGLLLPV